MRIYAINHKSRALELASERKKSADLEATQRAMAQRIRDLEESFANTLPTPGTARKSPRCSVRIFEPANTATAPGGGVIGEVVNGDEDRSSSDESEENQWNDDYGNDGPSAIVKKTSTPASRYPSRTSRTAAGANAAWSLDGVG